jgi:sRNA-binding carbon storage regulator CsrA
MGLLLTRCEGERIRLLLPDGRIVWVQVARLKRGAVQLHIDAPPDVVIHREELLSDNTLIVRAP